MFHMYFKKFIHFLIPLLLRETVEFLLEEFPFLADFEVADDFLPLDEAELFLLSLAILAFMSLSFWEAPPLAFDFLDGL